MIVTYETVKRLSFNEREVSNITPKGNVASGLME